MLSLVETGDLVTTDWLPVGLDRHLQRVGGGGRGIDWEFGVGRCKLLHLEWINNILLYSTGNGIQSGTNHNRKEYFHKIRMHICI